MIREIEKMRNYTHTPSILSNNLFLPTIRMRYSGTLSLPLALHSLSIQSMLSFVAEASMVQSGPFTMEQNRVG